MRTQAEILVIASSEKVCFAASAQIDTGNYGMVTHPGGIQRCLAEALNQGCSSAGLDHEGKGCVQHTSVVISGQTLQIKSADSAWDRNHDHEFYNPRL